MIGSLSWAPTVALSWLWGLGFFYSFHVTLTHGVAGFALFALPNAAGLFLFGYVLQRHRDPSALFAAVAGRYGGFMLAYQALAAGVTLYGFAAYFLIPVLGREFALQGAAVLALGSSIVGHLVPARGFRLLHAAYLPAGLAAAVVAGLAMPVPGSVALGGTAGLDARFAGLVLPSLVGFLIGPWLDVQQWQRVVEMRRDGANASHAYAGGALLFLGLLCANACLALASGPVRGHLAVDGLTDAEPSVAYAAAASSLAVSALGAWVTLAMTSTLDGAYASTRWLLATVVSRSKNPLLAFVPPSLATSPVPLACAGLAIAWAGLDGNLSLLHLMAPFATLLAGAGACLAAEGAGGTPRFDGTLCLLTGTLSAALFAAGYVAPHPGLLWLSTLVALVPAAGPAYWLARGRRAGAPSDAHAPVAANSDADVVAVPSGIGASASHGFEDGWYVMRLVPTYDDTNSVGNVYFANYVRWVGKARELFFAACMPGFDLKTTPFYVLTKSFRHDFRGETTEFDQVTVRLRIKSSNRKFVTLQHEIASERTGILGRGEQDLMFVDSATYALVDIPGDIMRGFLPHFQAARDRAA